MIAVADFVINERMFDIRYCVFAVTKTLLKYSYTHIVTIVTHWHGPII